VDLFTFPEPSGGRVTIGQDVLKLLAFVLPLGLDSFAIAAMLGALGLSRRDWWRISALFVGFEAAMPLVGLALGAPLARAVGGVADYLAAAALVGIGAWMLLGENEEAEEAKARRLTTARGWAVVGLGVGISLDELAIGFSLGLTRLSIVEVVIAIGVQAFIAVQVGLYLGGRIGERFREGVERVAAVVLILLGLWLVAARLLHH
jgi:putative Mn2+ efflux pump MntP